MAEGFGPAARSWASRLPADLALIAIDFNRPAIGLAQVAERKVSGECIAGSVLMPDLRSVIAVSHAYQIWASQRNTDDRTNLFTALAGNNLLRDGVPQCDWIKIDPTISPSLREFLLACDILVTRSETERQRLVNAVGYCPSTVLQVAPLDPLVPPAPTRFARQAGIVVWAPGATSSQCAVFAFGLHTLRMPVTILCHTIDGVPTDGTVRFFTVAERSDLLAEAAVIVDASPDDPGSALALARYGVPIVAACTSGAHEWLAPLTLYSPWSARSIFDAVMTALGQCPPHVLRNDDGLAALQRELDVNNTLIASGPLVSIVIPTFNRRARLRRALESVAKQRYSPLEIVVINDGGEDIADIVADFPAARLIENSSNLGVTPSINVGIQAAQGEYLGFLADDDFLQPDHVARLVAALEQSGQDVAHSKELALHFDVEADGKLTLLGHHIGAPSPTHYDDMLVSNRIGGPSVMVRRRALEALGPFDSAMRHGSDFEMWMRLIGRHDFVFVDHLTAHVSMRNDRSQLSSVSGAETAAIMERIYAKHPTAARPTIESARIAALAVCVSQSVVRSSPVRTLTSTDIEELVLHMSS